MGMGACVRLITSISRLQSHRLLTPRCSRLVSLHRAVWPCTSICVWNEWREKSQQRGRIRQLFSPLLFPLWRCRAAASGEGARRAQPLARSAANVRAGATAALRTKGTALTPGRTVRPGPLLRTVLVTRFACVADCLSTNVVICACMCKLYGYGRRVT